MLRYLPFLLVLALLVYSVAWLFTGRSRRGPAGGSTPSEWHRDAAANWVAPDDNPEFLKSLENRDDPRPD